MAEKYLSIQDAAEISDKSIQTIRRAIKSKKLKSKKQRTPQGFNYLIEKDSLYECYEIAQEPAKQVPTEKREEIKMEETQKSEMPKEKAIAENEKENENAEAISTVSKDLKNLTSLLEEMVRQHSDERRNFLKLVNTLQEKIFILENQVNLLQAPKRRWYQVWK